MTANKESQNRFKVHDESLGMCLLLTALPSLLVPIGLSEITGKRCAATSSPYFFDDLDSGLLGSLEHHGAEGLVLLTQDGNAKH